MSILNMASKSKHAPLIAAGVGIAGVIGVAVSASRDTLKAKRKLDAERDSIDFAINRIKQRAAEIKGESANSHENVDPQKSFDLKSASYELIQKVKYVVPLVWKCYIPTAVISAATISAVFLSWKFGRTQLNASKLATYMAQETFKSYSTNVKRRLAEGSLTEETLKQEEAEARIVKSNDPGSDPSVLIVAGDQVPVLDGYSGRTFYSSVASIREAVNNVNEEIFGNLYSSLTDFYDHLGLEPTGGSDEVGWNADHPLKVTFGAVLLDNGKPCIRMDYELDPYHGYAELR